MGGLLHLVSEEGPGRAAAPTSPLITVQNVTVQRIFCKTAVLTRRVNTTAVPAYLKEHLVQRVPSRQTRSAASLLRVSSGDESDRCGAGERASCQISGQSRPLISLTTDWFRNSYAAPVNWNSLPTEVMLCDSEHSFKRQLKTFLFNNCHQTVSLIRHQRLSSLLWAYMALYKCDYYFLHILFYCCCCYCY